ncbi:MAG: hypothetical protein H7Y17_06995 [Chlorobia bacterium]|nr:hypothetical protein [Fimbriimonadaceae bacterium]
MKKALLFGLPILLLAIGAGLVMTGVVKIPGMGAKAKAKSTQLYEEGKDPKVAEKKASPAAQLPKKIVPPPKVDAEVLVDNKPELGQKKLAKLWNEIETPALKDLTKDWKDAELAPVLMRMDSAKVAELLSTLEPKKASSLSRELQRQASVVARVTAS